MHNEVLAAEIADEMLGINILDAPIYLQLQLKAVIIEGISRYCAALDDAANLIKSIETEQGQTVSPDPVHKVN